MIDRLLARDSEIDMRIERDMCFFRRLQHRDTATSFFNTHTHSLTPTLTHTPHMTGQQWLAGQVVPEEFFFRVLQIFLTKTGSARIFFWQPGGHATSENYFQSVRNVFVCLCLFLYAGTMLQKFKVMLGILLKCKAQLLEINRAPTAG